MAVGGSKVGGSSAITTVMVGEGVGTGVLVGDGVAIGDTKVGVAVGVVVGVTVGGVVGVTVGVAVGNTADVGNRVGVASTPTVNGLPITGDSKPCAVAT